MALVLKDRVKETCTGTSGDMALTGAVSGFIAFDADATFDGGTTTTYYALEDADGTKWEVGLGTLSADSTVLTRTTILATQVSFTDTTRQTFSGGAHTIFCTYPAGKSVHLDGSGNLSHTVALTTDTSGNYVATITGGTGIDSDGATTGEGIAHSLSLDLNELSGAVLATGDSIVFIDADDNSSKKEAFNDVLDTIAGTVGTTGLDRSGGTLVVSDLHPVGVSGSADQLLTDDGDGTVTSEANLTFDGSTLTTTSGIVRKVVNKVDGAAVYTMTAADHIVLVDTTDANRVITLPAASADNVGQEFTIKKIDSGTGQVHITPAVTGGYGPNDIDEYDLKFVLYAQHDSVTFVCGEGDATAGDEQWWIIAEKTQPHCAQMVQEAVQSVASGSDVKIDFPAVSGLESFAIGCTADATNNRITITRPGKYLIGGGGGVTDPSNNSTKSSYVLMKIYDNSAGASTWLGRSRSASNFDGDHADTTSCLADLAIDDYVEIYVHHDYGSNRNTIVGTDWSTRPFLFVSEIKS
jgi:hypothetical protein